ncbi:MAG: ORF6N domain-containing protein [Bacteroidota bacterium]
MAKVSGSLMIPDERVMNKIYLIRGQKVMLDRDLSELYQVETKRLKEAVRRNIDRFPEDFMFEMTVEELENWRTQFASSNSEKMGLRYPPFCFTEQGVAMLSSILNSEIAIHVNIQIIRIFTKMRQVILEHKDILLQLEKIENKLTKHDEDIVLIFQYLKKLLDPPQIPRPKVGFRRSNEKE